MRAVLDDDNPGLRVKQTLDLVEQLTCVAFDPGDARMLAYPPRHRLVGEVDGDDAPIVHQVTQMGQGQRAAAEPVADLDDDVGSLFV